MSKPTLILSNRYSKDSNTLWKTAIDIGWQIERITSSSWNIPYIPYEPVLYGEVMFNERIAEQLNMKMVQPEEDFLSKLPWKYVKRNISYSTISKARQLQLPRFIKPPNYKSFPAKIYTNGAELPNHLDDNENIIISDVVTWIFEARFFILNRKIITWSPYLIKDNINFSKNWNRVINKDVKEIVYRTINDLGINLPKALVIDAGLTKENGPAIIEANEICGSGIYGCNPKKVLQTLRYGLDKKL